MRTEWRNNRSQAACRHCGDVPPKRMSMRVCADCAEINALFYWERRNSGQCVSLLNKKQAKCIQCGVVPKIKMSHRVCVDCAGVNRIIHSADYYEAHKVG